MTSPDPNDIVERLRAIREAVDAGQLDLRDVGQLLTGKWDQELPAWLLTTADTITSLRAEVGEARALNNKYAWERDKAREERDGAERKSEAFWKPQCEAAIAERDRLRAEVEGLREALKQK